METQIDYWDAHALLEWHIELGADEAICDAPINRYDIVDAPPKSKASAPQTFAPPVTPEVDAVSEAVAAAKSASDLGALKAAMMAFEHCDLKKGAQNLVFAQGDPAANVMVIGDAPGREEDKSGHPFAGPAGVLAGKMFGAIGLSVEGAEGTEPLYTALAMPWRPPQNRDPSPLELAMMKPFLLRHIELADPKILVLAGNLASMALLGKGGITRLRGQWQTVLGRPAMPMLNPTFVLRQPLSKRDTWADLLEIRAKLDAAN